MAPPIDVRFDDDIAIITMQDGRNQIDMEFVKNMSTALQQVIRYKMQVSVHYPTGTPAVAISCRSC